MILGTQGGVESENSEKLEFDDHLNENAKFLRSKGSKMRPKWYRNGPRRGRRAEKKAKESREAQTVLSRASWERSGATSFDFGVPGGGSVEFAPGLDLLAGPRISEGLGPKSEQKCCKVAQIRDIAISWILASQ